MTFTHPLDTAPGSEDHEQVVIRQDPASGLRLVVAVHSTALGPALGGLRLRPYPRGLREALDDALALARTMTLKAAAAGLELGGGKAVMIDDGDERRRAARLRLAGDVIEGLGGTYVTAEDLGTTTADMDVIATRSRFVVGRSPAAGGRGDPSAATAQTVLRALGAGLAAATGSRRLEGRRVGVLGLGKVGSRLGALLGLAGAEVLACDLERERAEAFVEENGGELISSPAALLATRLDALAPCATGGLIDTAVAGSLECRVVAGAANNQLADPASGVVLARRGVVYVPDFLANCGGLIHVAGEWFGWGERETGSRVDRAMATLERVLADAAGRGLPPAEVAERHALERLRAARAPVPRAA